MEAAAAARKRSSERARKKMDDRLGDLIRGKKTLVDRLKTTPSLGKLVGGVAEIQSVLDIGGIISNAGKPNEVWDVSETLMAELNFHKRLSVIKLLLSYGALHQNPSMLAYEAKIWELPIITVRYLLEYWDNPNILDGDRGTALFNTVIYDGSVAHVSLLLEYGADPNLDIGAHRYGYNQGSPLNAACVNLRVDIVKILLENGAEVNKAAGWPRLTPMQMLTNRKTRFSSFRDYEEVRDLLKSYGADDVGSERFRKLPGI
jgi:hypothetical protein